MSTDIYDVVVVGAKGIGKGAWFKSFLRSYGCSYNKDTNPIHIIVKTTSGSSIQLRVREGKPYLPDLRETTAVIICYNVGDYSSIREVAHLIQDNSLNSFVIGLDCKRSGALSFNVPGLYVDNVNNTQCGQDVFLRIIQDITDTQSVRIASVSVYDKRVDELTSLISRLEHLLRESKDKLEHLLHSQEDEFDF